MLCQAPCTPPGPFFAPTPAHSEQAETNAALLELVRATLRSGRVAVMWGLIGCAAGQDYAAVLVPDEACRA